MQPAHKHLPLYVIDNDHEDGYHIPQAITSPTARCGFAGVPDEVILYGADDYPTTDPGARDFCTACLVEWQRVRDIVAGVEAIFNNDDMFHEILQEIADGLGVSGRRIMSDGSVKEFKANRTAEGT